MLILACTLQGVKVIWGHRLIVIKVTAVLSLPVIGGVDVDNLKVNAGS